MANVIEKEVEVSVERQAQLTPSYFERSMVDAAHVYAERERVSVLCSFSIDSSKKGGLR